MIFEILLIVLLTVANGVLSMSELAVVSSRPARLASMAEKGDRGAQVALGLLEQPGKFLSSVQIGITLVGVLTGAVSGATLGARAAGALVRAGMPFGVAQTLGVFLVVTAPRPWPGCGADPPGGATGRGRRSVPLTPRHAAAPARFRLSPRRIAG